MTKMVLSFKRIKRVFTIVGNLNVEIIRSKSAVSELAQSARHELALDLPVVADVLERIRFRVDGTVRASPVGRVAHETL